MAAHRNRNLCLAEFLPPSILSEYDDFVKTVEHAFEMRPNKPVWQVPADVSDFTLLIPGRLSRHVNKEGRFVYADWRKGCSVETSSNFIIDPITKFAYRLELGGVVQWLPTSFLPRPFSSRYLPGKVETMRLAVNEHRHSLLAVHRADVTDNLRVHYTTVYTDKGEELNSESVHWMKNFLRRRGDLGSRQLLSELLDPPSDTTVQPNSQTLVSIGKKRFTLSREGSVLTVYRTDNPKSVISKTTHSLDTDPTVFLTDELLIVSCQYGHAIRV